MAENSGIEWTDNTFNPWWGCVRVSPGCEHCYAETLAVTRRKLPVWGPARTTDRKMMSEEYWKGPVKWNKRAEKNGVRERVFCASMADVFEAHPGVVVARERLFRLIEATPMLDWQLLTKRPENVMDMVPEAWRDAFPANVWIGTSVENQRYADERIPELLKIPARVRFLSCEPLLGPVDLSAVPWRHGAMAAKGWKGVLRVHSEPDDFVYWSQRDAIQWVIVGGESGDGARPFDVAWARSIVRECQQAGVAVFVKQMGANVSGLVKLKSKKGGDISEWPEDLRVREMPMSVPA